MAIARAPSPATVAAVPAAPGGRPSRRRVVPVGASVVPRRLDGPPVMRLGPGAARTTAPVQLQALVTSPRPGEPLPDVVRVPLERTFDVDLTDVRVHTEPEATTVVDTVQARAVTYGTHIFLGRSERTTDLDLMAHEVTHVIQQQGAHVFQLFATGGTDRFEREAQRASTSAQRGAHMSVAERTGGPAVQGRIPIISDIVEWAEDKVWDLLERFAPTLVPIFRKGVFEWLKEKLSDALQAIVDTIAAPIRAVGEVVNGIRTHFTNLVTWLRDAAARIAQGDCGAISEAADKIHQVFDGLAGPVIERVQSYVDKVKNFFSGLWDRFGAPIWDLLKRIGGAIWETIERIGKWIWDKTQPVRDLAARAWKWLKNLIGIGEGDEGQNGILQWFQRKASAAWDWVSERIAPFKRQILIVVGVIVMLSPAGPFIAIVAAAAGILRGVQWLRQNMRSRNAVVQQQSFLRGTILPAILGAISSVSGLVRSVANGITNVLTRIVGALTSLGDSVGSIPLIGFARGLVDLVTGVFRGLLTWASEGVQGLATWIQGGLDRLGGFVRRVVDVLEEILRLVGNFMRLMGSVFRRVWNAIPKCIRDPFVDWFIPLILRNIPFFSELASTPEAWAQTKAQVTTLLVQVFVNFDLIGAMKTVFRLVVRILRIPLDLMDQLLQKASQAWDLVLAKPLQFVQNAIKAILQGVGKFMRNILSHLWFGVQGWLLNAVGDRSITLPSSLTDWRGWLGMVLSILGLSVDHVIDLIDLRFPGSGRRLRQALNFLTGALEWVRIGLTEGPAGLWRQLMQRLSDLGNAVIEAAVKWVMERVIAIISARLAALAASAGLSGVLEAVFAVYQAIKTAAEYATRIITMLIKVFDAIIQIANGVIDPAATTLEQAFRQAMPVIIGFLANYAGLGGIGRRVAEIIQNVRKKVDDAILALIDGVAALIRGVLNAISRGVQAVRDWWRERKDFTAAGEPHHLYFEGQQSSARLMFSSAPEMLETYYNNTLKSVKPADAAHGRIAKAISDLKTIYLNTGGGFGQQAGRDIRDILNTLSDDIAHLLGEDIPLTELDPTITTTIGGASVVGTEVHAKIISTRPGGFSGSAPFGITPLWQAVSRRPGYVRGHILNHNLYGKGENRNLVPLWGAFNTGKMSAQVEEKVKKAVFQDKWIVAYTVKATFGKHANRDTADLTNNWIPEEAGLPTHLAFTATPLKRTGTTWGPDAGRSIPITTSLDHVLPDDTPPVRLPAVNLNTASASDMAQAMMPGIGPARAAAIVALRTARAKQTPPVLRFATYEDLQQAGVPQKSIDKLRAAGRITLY